MRFLSTVEGSYFAAPSRNNSASYKANLHEVCPTKVRGTSEIEEQAGIARPSFFLAECA
jgi:hypothetical protein